jgi:hypothetical protein
MSTLPDLRSLIGDPRQLAYVRRVEYLDGPERGLEALDLRAGPLAMTLLAGRALEIGQVHWRGMPLGWISPAVHTHPAHIDVEGDDGTGFERAFSGFMNTGGLMHIGQPFDGHPLHGRLAFAPARILTAREDPASGALLVEAEIRQFHLNRENLRMVRRIEVAFDGSEIKLTDIVTNEGTRPVAPKLLYHVNFGYPAVTAQSRLLLNGTLIIDSPAMPDLGPPVDSQRFQAGPGPVATARLETGSFAAEIDFATDTLPVLQTWRQFAPRYGVFSVEPITGASRDPHPELQPLESRSYHLAWRFSGDLSIS